MIDKGSRLSKWAKLEIQTMKRTRKNKTSSKKEIPQARCTPIGSSKVMRICGPVYIIPAKILEKPRPIRQLPQDKVK